MLSARSETSPSLWSKALSSLDVCGNQQANITAQFGRTEADRRVALGGVVVDIYVVSVVPEFDSCAEQLRRCGVGDLPVDSGAVRFDCGAQIIECMGDCAGSRAEGNSGLVLGLA